MRLRRNSFVATFAGLGLVFAWTGTLVASEPGPDDDKEALARGKELFTREWIAGIAGATPAMDWGRYTTLNRAPPAIGYCVQPHWRHTSGA
jgi:hypothetical protein